MVFQRDLPDQHRRLRTSEDRNREATPGMTPRLSINPESSVALGFGFRCGFLGLLHMEIIQERLRREYNMDIIATSPSVVYEVLTTRGEKLSIDIRLTCQIRV